MIEKTMYTTSDGQEFYDLDEAEIREEIDAVNLKQKELRQEILIIQEKCTHNHLTIQAKSNTGNYCKSDDSYWYDAHCRACDKSWHVDQSEKSFISDMYSKSYKDSRIIIKK